jgi:hypothetical protein
MKEITSSYRFKASVSSKLDIPQDNLFSFYTMNIQTYCRCFFEKNLSFLSFFIPTLFTVNKNHIFNLKIALIRLCFKFFHRSISLKTVIMQL